MRYGIGRGLPGSEGRWSGTGAETDSGGKGRGPPGRHERGALKVAAEAPGGQVRPEPPAGAIPATAYARHAEGPPPAGDGPSARNTACSGYGPKQNYSTVSASVPR
jgi:hypothetical protein